MFPDAPTGMPPSKGGDFGGGGYGGGGGFANSGYGGPGVPQANVDALFPPAPGIYPPQQPQQQQEIYPPMQPQQPIYPPQQPLQPQVYQPPPMEKQPSAPPPVEYAPDEKPGFPSAAPPSNAGWVEPQLQPPANPAAYLEVAPSPPRPDPIAPIAFTEPPSYNEAEPRSVPSGDIPSPLSGLGDADIGFQEADPMAGFPMPPGAAEPVAYAAPTAPAGGIPDVPAEDPEANPTVGEESAVPDFDELLNRFHALKSDDASNGE